MRYVITGGAGYIGSTVCMHLNAMGVKPVIIDSGFFGYGALEGLLFELFNNYESFMEKGGWQEGDKIIHLAGLSNDPMANYDPAANKEINTHFTGRIMADILAAEVGVKFVFASTASIYGYNDSGTPLNETCDVNPNSAYAESNYEAELLLRDAAEVTDKIRVRCIRKATVMGFAPRLRLDLVVNTMVASALTTGKIRLFNAGKTWRPLVNVNDAARCYIWVSDKMPDHDLKFDIYNLLHDNYRISELGLDVRKILRSCGHDVDIETDDSVKETRSYALDGTKLRNKGFDTSIGVDNTVRELELHLTSGVFDLTDPIHKNIAWIKNCERVCSIMGHGFDMFA